MIKIKNRKHKSKLRENIETILSAILIALVIRVFLIEAYKIPSGSMVPTLIEGDYLLVNKFIYGVRIPILGWKLPAFKDPKRGDIVVFYYPKYIPKHWTIELVDLITFSIFSLTNTEDRPKNFIKRLVGIPGDIINIGNKSISINGKKLKTNTAISKESWEEVKDITEPEKYTNPGSNNKFYTRKNSVVKSKDLNFNLLLETIGEKTHFIQLENDNYYNAQPDIEYLYIPKKDDVLELVFYEIEKEKKVFFKVNGDLKYIVNFDALFPDTDIDSPDKYIYEDNGYLFSYYLNILPNNTKEILSSKKSYKQKIKANYYFMVGDNRDRSSDSRKWGLVHEDFIIGNPILLYYPINRFAKVPH